MAPPSPVTAGRKPPTSNSSRKRSSKRRRFTIPDIGFQNLCNMSSSVPIIDSGLIGIALVIRSRDGPRFVYHYPPHPREGPSLEENLYGTELDSSEVEEFTNDGCDSDDSDLEGGGYASLHSAFKLDLNERRESKRPCHVDFNPDEHYDTPKGEHIVPWEHLFEFSVKDLESILTPSKAYHKRKFELSLDPLHFVSYPMHVREDGLWKKKRPKKVKKAKADGSVVGNGNSETKVAASEKKEANGNSEDEDDHGGMTMFNVVFMMDTFKDEADEKIGQLYEHVIKKFNKALNHAQASSSYVWKESEMILSMKEKAREERRPMSWLWGEIVIKSTLAKAIKELFLAISRNKIATLRFATTPPLDLSLQIPVPSFLMRLPSYDERAVPGLLVTTANPLIDEEGNEDPTHLNKHFALLLLDDETKVIAEIQADNTELSAPLIECIRLCKPTLSFLQVAQTKSVELGSLLILAQHLIYWRRAIAIPPLHPREVYIVSPNCDSRKLPTATIAWQKAFPLAPALPNFLAKLSAAPRAYKMFAPTKDHRPTYLNMLAWLIRGGWVTQLRTFAWILVWPEIVYEVQYHLQHEAIEKSKRCTKSQPGSSESASSESTDESSSASNRNHDPDAPLTTEQVAENARLERLADKAAKAAAEEALAFSKLPLPVQTPHPSTNNSAHLKNIEPYVIKDPHKISHEESLYIVAIGKRIVDVKAKECWTRWTKYFNGKEALEMIALQENRKRKETWGILMGYTEFLLVVKHW